MLPIAMGKRNDRREGSEISQKKRILQTSKSYYNCWQREAILQQRRAAYSTNAEVDELVQSSRSSSANQVTVNKDGCR